jgi:uncharacterized protein (DUF2062 family)
MPRKYFRKFLPTHQKVLGNRYLALFGSRLHHHNLWHLHRRSVAGGVAAGMFCGVLPAPFHFLTTAVCAILFRVNLPVAMVTTLYRNPITFIPLYLSAYYLGSLVTLSAGGAPMTLPPHFDFMHVGDSLYALAEWALSLGPPLAIGLPLLGAILGTIGYFSVRATWRMMVIHAWRERALRNAARRQAHA